MHIPKSLSVVFILLCSLVAARPVHRDLQGCGNFGFKADFVKGPAGELFTLTLTPNGGSPPYHFVLLDSKNNLMSKDFSNNIFNGLAIGSYRCIVADSNDCNKEQTIEVK